MPIFFAHQILTIFVSNKSNVSPSNMSVTLSTAYLPPVEYFYILNKYENIIIDVFENYQKQSYRNRCVIYSPNGPLNLVIPVIRPQKPKTIVKDVIISYYEDWPRTHWRSITAAYNSSPFFLFYQDELKTILEKKHKYLIDLNSELLEYLIRLIGISSNVKLSKKYHNKKDINDLREIISPKKEHMINSLPAYKQVFDDKSGFIENLSIIDLLFNEGPNSIEYLKNIKEVV
jgi:hypothetical protein